MVNTRPKRHSARDPIHAARRDASVIDSRLYSRFRLRSNGTRAPAPVVSSRVISNYR